MRTVGIRPYWWKNVCPLTRISVAIKLVKIEIDAPVTIRRRRPTRSASDPIGELKMASDAANAVTAAPTRIGRVQTFLEVDRQDRHVDDRVAQLGESGDDAQAD